MLTKALLSYVYERYGKYFYQELRHEIQQNISTIKCDSGFVEFISSLHSQFYETGKIDAHGKRNRNLMKKIIIVRYYAIVWQPYYTWCISYAVKTILYSLYSIALVNFRLYRTVDIDFDAISKRQKMSVGFQNFGFPWNPC